MDKKLFNDIYYKSVSDNNIGNPFGKQLLLLVDSIVNLSGVGDKRGDVVDIVKSDVCFECVMVANKLLRKSKPLSNPYGYFCNVIQRTTGRLLKERFSSNATRDEFGVSLVSARGSGSYVAKFVDAYDYKDAI